MQSKQTTTKALERKIEGMKKFKAAYVQAKKEGSITTIPFKK